jgi:heme/copper-type cytochrome/quinol oxidase subunit 3
MLTAVFASGFVLILSSPTVARLQENGDEHATSRGILGGYLGAVTGLMGLIFVVLVTRRRERASADEPVSITR